MVAVRAPDTLVLERVPPVREEAVRQPPRQGRSHRSWLGWAAVAGIGLSVAVMAAVSLAGPSAAVVSVPGNGMAAPLWIPLHLSATAVTVALMAASVLGGLGVAAGLAAVAAGARPSGRQLLGAAVLCVSGLTVLLPAGSSDSLDYAAYGRTVVLGHNPYQMTPEQLRATGDPIGRVAPVAWQQSPSVYGPAASAEQAFAAELGGSSPAAVVLWIKILNSIAFLAAALALDRLLRDDPARRARAHLLWSVNPLLLWGLVAAGHVDAIAAVAGLLGVLTLTSAGLRSPGAAWRALAAGMLVGLAADVKITFALFGVGVAWAARKSPRAVAASAAGAAAVLIPSYLAFSGRALAVLAARRAAATMDNFYQLLARPFGLSTLPGLSLVAVAVFAAVAVLLLRRLPDRLPSLPAVQPALAIAMAWLLTWPYQRPWYDALALCLLAIYPASRLDWLMMARLLAITVYYLPGMPGLHGGWLSVLNHWETTLVVPVLRLAFLAVAVLWCVPWARHDRFAPAPAGLAPVR